MHPRLTLASTSVWWTHAAVSAVLVLASPLLLHTPSLERQKPPAVWTLAAIWLFTAFAGSLWGLATSFGSRRRTTVSTARGRSLGALAAAITLWIVWYLVARTPDAHSEIGMRIALVVAPAIAVIGFRAPATMTAHLVPSMVSLALVGLIWLDKQVLEPRYDHIVRWSALTGFISALLLISLMFARRKQRELSTTRMIAIMAAQFTIVIGLAAWMNRPASLPSTAMSRPAVPRRAANVIVIVLDTVRAKNMSLYGYSRKNTPFLEELAREMTVYRGVSSSDMTLSTHASLFTGLSPTRHGAHVNEVFLETGWSGIPEQPGRPLAPSIPTMAEILARRGYVTASIAANCAYLGELFGLARGFDYTDPREPGQVETAAPSFLPRSFLFKVLHQINVVDAPRNIYRTAEEINEDAGAVIEQLAAADRRFLLFINYMDAHAPYAPPAPFDRLYPGKIEGFGVEDHWELDRNVMSGGADVSREHRNHLISQYDGAIAYLDSQLRVLIGRLKALGLYDDTLIIITSDHGEAFGSRGYLEHAWSVHGELVEVPMLVKTPRQRQGRTSASLATSTDVFATVIDAAGLPVPPGTEGISLLRADPPPDRYVVAESFPSPWYSTNETLRRMQRAMQSGQLKLIHNSPGTAQFYDKAVDPEERQDLSTDRRYEEARLRFEKAHDLWVSAATAPPTQTVQPDADTIRMLRSLGYIR